MAKLGDYASFIMGQAPASKDCNVDGNGTPFVKAGQFGESTPIINEWTTNPLKVASDKDVLICVVGATSGKLNRGVNCAIGRSVAAIRPHEKVIRDYIYYGLHPWIQRLRGSSQGSAIGVITKDMLDAVEMPFPEEERQIEIVRTLSLIESVIRKRKEELVRIDDLIKARFVEMFGDPVSNEKGFEIKSGEEVFKLSNGKFVPEHKRLESGIPVYGGNGISWYTDEILSEGDTVVVGRVGFQSGNVHLADGPLWISDNAMFISHVYDSGYDLRFLYWVMEHIDFTRFQDAGDLKKITQKPFMQMNYIKPPISMQRDYNVFVAQVDKSKVAVQKSLDEMKLLFDSLMQEYFG